MEVAFISNSVVINNYTIEPYLVLENNYIDILWKVLDSEGISIRDKLHTLAHAKFYVENNLK